MFSRLRPALARCRVPVRRGLAVAAALALAAVAIFAWRHFAHRPARVSGRRHRTAAAAVVPAVPPAVPAATPAPAPPPPAIVVPEIYPRDAANWLDAQIELARRGYSCGSIDGVGGAQTAAALRAFQEEEELSGSGQLDRATRHRLQLAEPPLAPATVSPEDLARLQPLSTTWLGKSQQSALDFATVLELVAERHHAHPNLIRQLNPGVDWDRVVAGTKLTVPMVDRPARQDRATEVHIFLGDHVLQVRDADDSLLLHCPVSIARDVEKRPVGELHVTVVIRNPNYTFDPDVFPESAEGRELGRRLVLPPGPNNPVGLVWIGLDRPGYGIHGTPNPEQVGRTESHGCFRLANWDALDLADLIAAGMPVFVDP